ncbi:probable tRNA methyltransferase 9B isoform X2 [Hemiscyllium ocellatum]|uniref:probable tRNA methyltransferase 9B isoform X2 n=1 Tax=Hemiscyllium ocellatum TaxID=170820 RepID=UPI0029662866|nr:probable tRNA methyltransferase 9B isoform X2 [Hemiscyllium ocellatum]
MHDFTMDKEASRLEKDYVHDVYERIAPHFNDSRYKAWPRVRHFLLEQEPGSLIADVVIHHFSTKERRVQAIKEMARILRVRGKMMIYVWAMEQNRRKFEKQDIFIPWNPTPPPSRSKILNEQNTSIQQINNEFFHKGKPLNSNKLASSEFSLCKKHIKGNQVSSLVMANTLLFEKSLNLWIFSQSLNSSQQFSSNNRTKSPKEIWMFGDYISSFKTNIKFSEQRKTDNMTRFVSNVFSYGQHSEDGFDVLSKSQSLRHYNISDPHTLFFEHPCVGSFKVQESSSILHRCSEVSLPDLTSQPLFQNESLNCLSENKSASDSTFENINSVHPQMQRNVTTDSSNWPLESQVLAKDKNDQTNYNSTCLRYYHVFKQGELIELIEKHIKDLQVIQAYYDHANWCVVVEKVRVCKI